MIQTVKATCSTITDIQSKTTINTLNNTDQPATIQEAPHLITQILEPLTISKLVRSLTREKSLEVCRNKLTSLSQLTSQRIESSH